MRRFGLCIYPCLDPCDPWSNMELTMKRLAIILLTTAVAVAEPPKTHQIKLNGHTFTLPDGFTIERVAGPPLVDRPIVAVFDEQGRLYVADSSGSNEKVAEAARRRSRTASSAWKTPTATARSTRRPSSPTR